jgi:hypothetical protein
MKPLNLDNRPCNPISSNCVIWQGPDIPCINLCAGDSVSDVVFKLATELCIIMDQLNVSNYDLSCLSLTSCPPENFQALIQLLINKVCAANGITTDIKVNSTCPDCVVSVAPCFVQGNQTTMQLLDYVQMIAQKICALIDQIGALQTQINNLDVRVTVLENAVPPSFTLPSFIVNCTLDPASVLGGNAYTIDVILNALVNNDIYGYCALLGALGLPAALESSVASACITATTPTISNAPTPYGTQYLGSWVNTPTTVADSINNIWLVLCDYYDALSSLGLSVTDTNTVNLNLSSGILTASVQDTGWVFLEGFDYYTDSMASQRPQCRRIGNVIHFRGTVVFPLSSTNDGSTLVLLNTATAYNAQPYPYTYGNTAGTLPNGTELNVNGSVYFNNNTSCIPSTVWAGALDGTYGLGWIIATRQINVDASYGAALSATLNVFVNSSGVLLAATVKDTELSTTRPNGMRGTSPLRFINTNIRTEQVIPNFINADTDIHNLPAPGVSNLVAESEFTSQLAVDVPSLAWPFSCDSGEETNLGGFSFRLDGLMTYVSPCAATEPTPAPCV